jgi:hypothetical protein
MITHAYVRTCMVIEFEVSYINTVSQRPCVNIEFVDTQRKLARGGESPRLRDVAVCALCRALTGRSIMPWNPSKRLRSASLDDGLLNWRSVYGLAVAAAWFLYKRCRLCGVAAPGLEVDDMSPPFFSMDATSSAHKQTGAPSVRKVTNSVGGV